MIYTGNYENCSKSSKFVSISNDSDKKLNYKGRYYSPLVPKLELLKKWKANIGKIKEEENMRYYIENYYKEVLEELDIPELFYELGSKFIIGGHENSDEFSQRYIVAAYLELMLGIEINEIKIDNNKIITLPKNQMYKKISNILCETIIKDIDSRPERKQKTMILI